MFASVVRNQGQRLAARASCFAKHNPVVCNSARSHRSLFLPRAKAHIVSQRLIAPLNSSHARITRWSSYQSSPLKLRELCTVGLNDQHRLRHSSFLRRELCVRLAQSAAQLQCLPHGWAKQGVFRKIIDLHGDLIQALEKCASPETVAQDDKFADVLEYICKDLKTAGKVSTTLQGLQELTADLNDQAASVPLQVSSQVNQVLLPFFTLMTGMQFLIQHYMESRQGRRLGFSGILQLNCCPSTIARTAAHDSSSLCKSALGRVPEIIVKGDVCTTLTYVPAVLQYILTEILKNACRAVVERHIHCQDDELPAVICNIESSANGLVIKISDRGCGMSTQQVERMWDFMYTTCKHSPWTCAKTVQARDKPKPQSKVLAGYGVGLSLSRMYAQYFGGDLVVSSKEGHGTEVCVHLCHSAVCEEVLPEKFLFDPPLLRCSSKEEAPSKENEEFAHWEHPLVRSHVEDATVTCSPM